jgi:hypothetical protein
LPCTSPKGDAKTGNCTNLRRMMWQNINQCWPRNVIGGSTVWSFYKFPTGSCPKINCPKKHIVNSFLLIMVLSYGDGDTIFTHAYISAPAAPFQTSPYVEHATWVQRWFDWHMAALVDRTSRVSSFQLASTHR